MRERDGDRKEKERGQERFYASCNYIHKHTHPCHLLDEAGIEEEHKTLFDIAFA